MQLALTEAASPSLTCVGFMALSLEWAYYENRLMSAETRICQLTMTVISSRKKGDEMFFLKKNIKKTHFKTLQSPKLSRMRGNKERVALTSCVGRS